MKSGFARQIKRYDRQVQPKSLKVLLINIFFLSFSYRNVLFSFAVQSVELSVSDKFSFQKEGRKGCEKFRNENKFGKQNFHEELFTLEGKQVKKTQ